MRESTSTPDGVLSHSSGIGPSSASVEDVEALLMRKQMDVSILCDNYTKLLYVSPSIIDVLGFTPQEVIGKTFADFIHPDDMAAVAEDWIRYNNGQGGDPVNFRTRHKKGSWVRCEARSVVVEDDRFPGCSCVNLREVEHHYRLEQRMAAAENMAGFASWKWEVESGRPNWSQSHYTLLGYEPSETDLDLDWATSLIHPDDSEVVRQHLMDSLETPKPFTLETRMMAADGKYRTIIQHCYAEHDGTGAVKALIGLCHDITDKREAEKKLRQSERFYRALTEDASDFIMRFDELGKYSFASPAVERILGFTPEEVLQANALSYIYDEDRHLIQDVYEKLAEGLDSQRVTYRAIRKDKKVIWLEASVRAIRDRQGDLNEVVVVARDVTERHNYEEKLRKAMARAEAANQTKSKLLANVSHELRTPLNAIIGFSDIMREEMFGPLGSDQYKDYIRLVHESGQFLLDLINDILDISKIEAGKYELFIEEVNAPQVLDTCFSVMAQRAQEAGVELRGDLDPHLTEIPVDERAFKQMMLNLVSNAVKFTEPGGSVTVSSAQHGNFIEFAVQDTGIGIPAEALPRLGQPFEQAANDATQAQQGTGLGLALVKSFAELHGGMLTLESEEGEGTTVRFTLPLFQERRQEDRRQSA